MYEFLGALVNVSAKSSKAHGLVGEADRDELRDTKERRLNKGREVVIRLKCDAVEGREEERMWVHSGEKEECGEQMFEERDLNV